MNPSSGTSLAGRIESKDQVFPILGKNQKSPAAAYFGKRWDKMELFQKQIQSHPSSNILTTAIYTIPIVGTAVKIIDSCFCSLCLIEVSDMIKAPSDIDKRFVELQLRVAETQVNDLLFFASRVIHVVVLAVLGIILPELILGLLIVDLSMCLILALLHGEMGRSSSNELFKAVQNVDVSALKDIQKMMNERLHTEDEKESRNHLLANLHLIFCLYPENRNEIAKEIIKSKDYEKLLSKCCPLGGGSQERLIWMWIQGRIEQASKVPSTK